MLVWWFHDSVEGHTYFILILKLFDELTVYISEMSNNNKPFIKIVGIYISIWIAKLNRMRVWNHLSDHEKLDMNLPNGKDMNLTEFSLRN